MCGIAGLMVGIGGAPAGFDELRGMAAMLAHRGPDGYGLYRDARVGLAHTRLSLIDLASGAQPLSNADGTIWLCFNGEIFNYIELRQELAALGHRFATQSDSEVIIHCYERYGADAWARLNGQFAFAIWDTRARSLWLVRDRLGILPLHYARTAREIVFASEAKAIFAGGRIEPRFDEVGLSQTFVNWSAVAPRTVFKDVLQVPPATAIRIDDGLRLTERRYWQPDPARGRREMPIEEAADRLEQHLERSIALRLRADVPVGAYISGGLDSSLLGTLARRKVDGLETFGIRFADPRFDETVPQRLVAHGLGTHHHEILCDGATIGNALAEAVWHCETPLLRASPVPLFLLSGLVQQAGIKTVLTGEGADELFCGYSIFKESQIRRFWARRPDSAVRPLLLQRVHHYVGSEAARSNPLWQAFFRAGLTDTGDPYYSHRLRWSNTAWTLRLLAPEMRAAFRIETLLADLDRQMPAGWQGWEPMARAQYIEIAGFMSSYLLSSQGDRVAMAHGVEARYPFLDPELFEFAFALPTRFKLLGSRDKLLLRKVAKAYLPDEIWGRRKQPFRAPIGADLFAGAEYALDDGIGSNESGAGLIDEAARRRLFARARDAGGVGLSERENMGLIGIMTLRRLHGFFGPEFRDRVLAANRKLAALPCHVLVDRAA